MPELSVNFMGLELKNPLVVASSECVRHISQLKKAEDCHASAVILKTVLPPGACGLGEDMRLFTDIKSGAIMGIAGATRITTSQGIELVKQGKKETSLKIGVNIPLFRLEDTELYLDFAIRAEKAGADFVELNFSPQIPQHVGITQTKEDWESDKRPFMEQVSAGMMSVPVLAQKGVKIFTDALQIPVLAKIAPEGINVVDVAKAMETAGAKGIDCVNSFGGCFKMDIYNDGKPFMPGATTSVLRVSGAPMKLYAQGIQAKVARSVKVPVMGTGGIMNWVDTVESIMLGCTCVSYCALLMISGFEAIMSIEAQLQKFMSEQGYEKIDDFRGIALKYVSPNTASCKRIDCIPRIDMDKCSLCGKCWSLGHCIALSNQNQQVILSAADCLGCGVCSIVCPESAIEMIPYKKVG